MRNYETLKVWEKAHALVQDVYRATETFPRREMYGLTQQMRNAAASVPTNIVEGCGRQTEAELIHFVLWPWAPPQRSTIS
jgi:four helix bundle protein